MLTGARSRQLLLGALVLGACGAPQRSAPAETQALRGKLAELRADARRDRMKIRDLEVQLAQREHAAPPPATAAPDELPVEVREPEALSSPEALPDDYEIVGTDEEGVEIVYVGEAASDESFRPQVDRYDLSTGAEPAPSSTARSRPQRSARELEAVPSATDRLAVTGGVPTIDEQIRQARTPKPRGRARTAGDPRAEYQRYYQALRAGNHAYAVTGFRNFIARFPGHDYADNAQYWLGEAFYDQKKYPQAVAEFRRVVDDHAGGNKVPDALLKLGYCYQRLGDRDAAIEVLRKVVALYPKSNPARLAQSKLEELEP